MIDQRMEELMWLEIEGKISGGDREKLHRYLETDGDARGYFSDILRMAKLFGLAGEVDPPSELRDRILRALSEAAPPKAEKPGFAARLGALFSPRPVWRYAAVGAAGIVIGILGYHFVKSGNGIVEPIDIKQFYGSIAAGDSGLQGREVEIDLSVAKGAVTVRRNEASVLAELAIDSAGEVEVVLAYAGAPIEVAAGKLSAHPSNEVAIEDREVHVRNRGKGTYHILFSLHEDPSSTVTVRVLSQDGVLFEKEISPSRVPDRG